MDFLKCFALKSLDFCAFVKTQTTISATSLKMLLQIIRSFTFDCVFRILPNIKK